MHKVHTIIKIAGALMVATALVRSAYALDPDRNVTQYGHEAWRRKDGHLPGAVLALAQTRDGRLWIGTEFGLYHFDGITFVRWQPAGEPLPDQIVNALEAGPDGSLWIGMQDTVFHWKGEALRRFVANSGQSGSPVISTIHADKEGGAWLGTIGFHSGGLAHIDTIRLRYYTPADGFHGSGVYSLLEDRSGNLWVGCANGLFHWDRRRFVKYPVNASLQNVIALTEALDGSIVASIERGRELKLLTNGAALDYRLGTSTDQPQMRVLRTDRDGALWIGTNADGLIHVHEGRMDRFSRRDGLSGNTVTSIFEDREGNIWVGTEGGLDRFRDLPITTLSSREGLSADTAGSVIASASGGVWIGTTKGLNRVSGHRIEVYGKRNGLPADSIGSLFEDRMGRLWIGLLDRGSGGLAFRWNDRFHLLRIPGPPEVQQISAIVQDKAGILWFSDVERGLISVQDDEIKDILRWSIFDNRQAWALEADRKRGGIILGFAQGGIAHFQEGRPIKWYTAKDGLGRGAVTDILMDREGVTWIATQGGLSQLRDDRIATLDMGNDLGCNQIYGLVEAHDGAMWLHSACGLLRLARSDLEAWSANPARPVRPRIYGPRDGMHSRSKTMGFFRKAARSTDGRLWFPVLDGVAVVDPTHLHTNTVPPPVAIEAIRVDGRTFDPEAGLSFGPRVRDVQIDYTAFSFVDPERVHFRYKLEGYDQRWRDVIGRRQAVYSALPPGRYRFRVIACNNDGVWNKNGTYVDFAVEPALYQTPWFVVLSVVAIVCALFGAYRFRLRQVSAKMQMRLDERMRERTRIGSELHDTLLQNIAGLALQLDALSKIVKEPQSAKERARALRCEAEQWLHEVRESVWDLRSYDDTPRDFVGLLRQVGEQATRGTTIQFRVTSSGTQRAIPTKLQMHLKRIVQEALRNAVRHSGGAMVHLDVSYSDEYLVRVHIIDDGCGFDLDAASAKPGHWGLVTMRERGERLGAELKITATPGKGARIEVIVPKVAT